MIEARGVEFGYDKGSAPVLRGVDLTAHDGQVTGLLGPNGSGKTTLLRTLYGSLVPTAGAVHLQGSDVKHLSARDLARRVAVVVQEHGGDLPLSVADMVMLGRTPHQNGFGGLFGGAGAGTQSRRDRDLAAQALHRVGALHLAGRAFAGLSGGEKQRVLIARALTQSAEYLLLDEPTNHLDVRYQHEVLDLVRSLGTTVVVVLHDLNLAARYCDSVVVLQQGKVVASGTPGDVLTAAVLEPVYEVAVRRIDLDGEFHLSFRPQATTAPTTAPTAVTVKGTTQLEVGTR